MKGAYKRRIGKLRVEVSVKKRFKKNMVRSRLKWTGQKKYWMMRNWKRSDARKVAGKQGGEDRECDGRTALKENWNEWEGNVKHQQQIEGVGD